MNRKLIFQRLFALLQTVPGVKTCTRRPVMWDQLDTTKKPAIVLMQTNNGYSYPREVTPGLATLTAKILVYTDAGQDPKSVPVDVINDILDAIDSALAPKGGDITTGRQTLGGLVSHCRIEGDSNPIDDGALDQQGVAILNVKIFLPVTGL